MGQKTVLTAEELIQKVGQLTAKAGAREVFLSLPSGNITITVLRKDTEVRVRLQPNPARLYFEQFSADLDSSAEIKALTLVGFYGMPEMKPLDHGPMTGLEELAETLAEVSLKLTDIRAEIMLKLLPGLFERLEKNNINLVLLHGKLQEALVSRVWL